VEKMPTMANLRKMTFLGCTHGIIWALDTQEEACQESKSCIIEEIQLDSHQQIPRERVDL
jgi:hypothetical protein